MDSNKTNYGKRAGDFIIGCLCAGTGIVLAAMAKKYLGIKEKREKLSFSQSLKTFTYRVYQEYSLLHPH